MNALVPRTLTFDLELARAISDARALSALCVANAAAAESALRQRDELGEVLTGATEDIVHHRRKVRDLERALTRAQKRAGDAQLDLDDVDCLLSEFFDAYDQATEGPTVGGAADERLRAAIRALREWFFARVASGEADVERKVASHG